MCRADGEYHEKEREAVSKIAKAFGVNADTLSGLESVAEMEDVTDALRLSLIKPKA